MALKCPQDGYPMEQLPVLGGGGPLICTNPWHPHRHGPCPGCKSTREPEPLMGGDAVCKACGTVWTPGE